MRGAHCSGPEGAALAFTLPELKSAADAVTASTALVHAVAGGELTTGQAAELGKLVGSYVRAIEVSDVVDRLERLEGSVRRRLSAAWVDLAAAH